MSLHSSTEHENSSNVEEISKFASRILFGTTLEDKLKSPKALSDLKPDLSLKSIPSTPHRSPEFTLVSLGQNKRHKRELRPTVERLHDEHFRGRILHTFAHHELISLELMALALLRFPEAPSAFRRGLAKVIIDEQRHFRLYEERVKELGLSLGEEPVSDYFWRCVANAPDLASFNARLALVFEQANIDFTRHYAPLFRQVGDEDSAVALDQIYQDEISHVGLGLHWFRKWRPTNEPEWDSFCQLLEPPLSPGRAKGAVFSIEGRRAVGFSEDYIERLRLWGGSTGRPPLVWLGNFDFDEALHDQAVELGQLPPDKSPKRRSKRRKTRRQACEAFTPLLAWVCTRGDIVLCPQSQPSRQFQSLIAKARGLNPEWSCNIDELKERKLGGVQPWGWSQPTYARLEQLQASILPSAQQMPNSSMTETVFKFASKLELTNIRAEIAQALMTEQQSSALYFPQEHEDILWQAPQNIAELIQGLKDLNLSENWLCKRAYGSAGRGLKRLNLSQELDAPTLGWFERSLPLGLNIEPLLNRVADLSFHAWVEGQSIRYDGEVAGLVDDHGRFQGAFIGPPSSVLDSKVKRFLNGEGHDRRRLSRIGKAVTQIVGKKLMSHGYQGPFGVDALIAQSHDPQSQDRSLKLYPLVEINPRFTMGRLALHLRKTIESRANSKAYFKIFPNLTAIPSADLEQAKQATDDSNWDKQGQWLGSVLPLNDIWQELSKLESKQDLPIVLLYK